MAMWLIVFFVCLTSLASAQNEIGASQERGHGWDIRLAVPGEPGIDYPTLGVIPRTKFSCAGRDPGYFADVEAGCQVFRVCTVGSTYGFQSFLCPNGTLFNQAVFVCDWWMNVRCQESQQLLNTKNEQFGNLRLGPQLMKDVKKMLTHPMRNPYNRNSMKSKQIIMQDYRPPTGQLFPNEALIAGPERLSNKVHMPAKQVQQNIIQNSFSNIDNAFTTTSSDTKLLPAAFSTVSSVIRSNEIIQRQRSDTRAIQSTQIPLSTALVSNGHARQFENNNLNTQLQRPTQNYNLLNHQKQINTAMQTKNTQNNQRAQLFSQRTQYVDNKKALPSNLAKHSEFGRSIKQNILNSNQNYPAYTYRPPLPLNLNDIPGNVPDDVKQNVVSTAINIQPTVVTRPTATVRSLKESKPSRPRSRITIKTWLVKPTRAGRVITNPAPTPYSYNIPTTTSTEKLIDSTTPYVYNTPTAETLSEIDEEIQPTPYYYSRPTVSSRQIVSSTTRDLPRYYLPPLPTTPEPNPTFISRFDIPLSTPSSYMNNDEVLISPSSTSQPGSRYYLPPDNYPTISRQYLPSNPELPYQISQLKVTSSAPSPVYVSTTFSQTRPTVMVTQQAPINTKSDTLSFADILTKEKLDITVNDIVKDTDSILRTASPENIGHYREITKISDYPDDNYLSTTIDSGESLTSQVPIMPSISSRALELPVNHLVPPKESMPTQSTNKLSFLPYFKESLLPAPNTIERTVSLKITIPERIATYLFKNNNDSDFDRLEILNTGSSNYLVLSNNLVTSTSPSIVPIGKLVGSKTKNISNSQALVFSLLADSINAAKEYTSIAQQESLSTTLTPPPLPTPQFPNINNGDLSQITNGISQLTASQYSGNNYNSANLVSFTSQTPQTILTAQSNQFANINVNANHQKPGELQSTPYNVAKPRQIQDPFYAPQPSIDNSDLSALLNGNNNQIYSGQLYQLPVPEVTNQLINKPNTGETIQYNNIPQTNSQQLSNQNTGTKQPRTEVEVVKSQSVPINYDKIELEPTTERESVSSDESLKNLLNSNNGISAHLQDKIIGTIPHPLEQNKLVTYEKEKSYYLFSKVDNDISQQESKSDALTQLNKVKSDIVQTTASTNGFPNSLAFQLLPSISYQVEDEKDQQKLLNTFEIDEFGAPREVKANLVKDDLINNVDYSVDHTTTEKQDNQLSSVTTLYSGPSSYLAPQSSIGELSSKKEVAENNVNSKLETLDNSDGYPKERPTREFTF